MNAFELSRVFFIFPQRWKISALLSSLSPSHSHTYNMSGECLIKEKSNLLLSSSYYRIAKVGLEPFCAKKNEIDFARAQLVTVTLPSSDWPIAFI